MLAFPSTPPSMPEFLLTADHVGAVLEACGYRSTTVIASGPHSLPAGCMILLQFGDRIELGASGATRLTIRCSLVINGSNDHTGGVTCWQIRKLVDAPVMGNQLGLAIETDLLLGNDIPFRDILAHGRDVYRHLRLLIADARSTLQELPVYNGPRPRKDAPALRIEARVFGDLATGRSGLVMPDRSTRRDIPRSTTTRHLQITSAACDWLKADVLPDLARAVGRMIKQARSSIQDPRTEGGSTRNWQLRSHPQAWSQARPTSTGQVTLAPAHDPLQ